MRKLTLLLSLAAALAAGSLPAALADGTQGSTTTTAVTTTTATTTTTTPTTTTTTTTTPTSTTTPAATGPSGATGPTGPSGPAQRLDRPRHLHVHWFAGSVSSVGDSSVTVGVLWTGPKDGSFNGQTLTVAVVEGTRINGPRHQPIALATIQPGDLVAVRATGDDPSSLTAVAIRVYCNCHWIGGTIGSRGSDSFTVNVKRTGPYDTVLDNTTVTLQVNADTVYLRGRGRARIGFGDLQPGEGVGVVFGANGFFKAPGFDPSTATFTAKRVHVWGLRQLPAASTDASAAAGTAAA